MPSSVVRALAVKSGKSEAEVEKKWEEAKDIVKKKTNEKDKKFYPTVVSIVKNMLGLNEDATVTAATTTPDIATVPKRLGEKPVSRPGFDGNLNGFPYFEIKEVGDYMNIAQNKRANKKIDIKDERIHKHMKTHGGPFLVKYGNNTIKLTKNDIYHK